MFQLITTINRVIREFLWKQTTAIITKSHISQAFSGHPGEQKEGSI